MSLLDNLQYKTENISLYFQGGVRRGVLIFLGISLILLAPFYFLGQLTSNIFDRLPINPNKSSDKNIVIPKTIVENPLEFGNTQVVPLVEDENSLYLTISNKTNLGIGFFPFVYTTQILSSEDTILSQQTTSSYLLPGDVKYIVANSLDKNGVKIKVIRQPQTQPVSYNPNQNLLLKEPKITRQSQNIEILKDGKSLAVKAVFKNEDQLLIKKVNILYIIRDGRESVVGIGEYSFANFAPNTEREVAIIYPMPRDRTPVSANVIASVNYLDKSNFVLP